MSLLVTAFGRFDGGPNCSESLLEVLARERAELEALWGAPVAFRLLSVDTEAVGEALRTAITETRPTHVLLTGQAAGREGLSFETVARNRRDLHVADAGGRIGALGPVVEGGPGRLDATWPDLAGAAAALSAQGFPARLSDDAGAHLCNQTLYLAIAAGAQADPRFVTTFLHLPLIPEQVAANVPAAARLQSCFAMPLDDMARAARAFLVHTRLQERSDRTTPA